MVVLKSIAVAIALMVPHIKTSEGLKTIAYQERGGSPTVCYGHTGRDVKVGKHYSQAECESLLHKDLLNSAYIVSARNPELINNPVQLASALGLEYNIGSTRYHSSQVAKYFSQGNFKLACKSILKYTYSHHRRLKGLYKRRVIEYDICVSNL